ncbi:TRAP-T-associated universal stress protein TeaD [Oxobacter pfennigii]|uniref:TRAP-T-associated universal stress protein TeaD n=1 Tax=Oxobacter pfennigii TaxID=36849 RepID=A0A0P8WRF2_9CLOT|nr:universal stress protein [Oxobacter pfennigii]KPU45164.1 TRAP-T-associated universal stress protein TeaD [Oxobacter pfennigii]
MFKKILVPTDVSEASKRALDVALALAKQFESEVELFHVVYTPEPIVDAEATFNLAPLYPTPDQINEMGQAVMERALKDVDAGNIKIEKKFVAGHAAMEVIEEANKGFDLVVMGSRGQGPLTGAVLGSVAQRVLSGAHCPVLIVK